MGFWNGKALQKGKAKDVASQLDAAPQEYREAFKMLRTKIKAQLNDRPCYTIAVTSAVAGEGKSCVAVELAKAMAEGGGRVLLMDCNLRSPSIQEYLHLSTQKGLSEVLKGTPVSEAIVKIDTLKMDVLTAGAWVQNPSELLDSDQMQRLLHDLTSRYEYIILDTPAAAAIADAAIIGRYADQVLLVLRQDATKLSQAEQVKRNLEQVGANILGLVFNGCDFDSSVDKKAYYAAKK